LNRDEYKIPDEIPVSIFYLHRMMREMLLESGENFPDRFAELK
jgi:hypothetical protein